MYDHQQLDEQLGVIADVGTAVDPIATARKPVGSQPIMVRAIWYVVTTAQTTAVAVLTFKYRPTPGSATGQTTLGTLTVPIGAVGRIIYKNITPFKCDPGGEIVVQTDGGGEGNGALGIRYTTSWESLANITAAVASA